MTSVFNRNHQEDPFIVNLKEKLVACDDGSNPDLEVIFVGHLHNNRGFKLRVENVEVFNATLTTDWKEIIRDEGMEAEIKSDMTQAIIYITCTRVLRKRTSLRQNLPSFRSFKLPSIPFQSMLYILICSGCIYIEWSRHQDKFLS